VVVVVVVVAAVAVVVGTDESWGSSANLARSIRWFYLLCRKFLCLFAHLYQLLGYIKCHVGYLGDYVHQENPKMT